jgi:two-component system alkaline phosphatase synthesis response regulator PhoP
MTKILIVDDEQNIRDLVSYALQAAGFETMCFADGTELFAALRQELPTLILLDVMLPGDDGVTLLRRLKASARTSGLPVILLTAKGSEYDRVTGLDLGADDYVTKPFSVLELVSRVRAVLRRTESSAERVLKTGALTLDENRRSVAVNGTAVELTYKEFELLAYLMHNHDLVMTRDKLLNAVWGVDFAGESRTVDVHIQTLRQKLGSCGSVIKTVRNVGYKIGEMP